MSKIPEVARDHCAALQHGGAEGVYVLEKMTQSGCCGAGVTKYDYLPRAEKSEKNGLVLMHFKFKLLLGLPQFSSVNMTWNK